MKKFLLNSLLVLSISCVFAADNVDLSLLRQSIVQSSKIKSVKNSPIPGLYEVQIDNQIIYLSTDGKKIIRGDIYDLSKKINYTEIASNNIRKHVINAIPVADKIIYKAKNEKYKIVVFTDITCSYCVKFHKDIPKINELGITVEYLSFPRAGLGSKSAKNMQNIWCSKNKALTLTNAKENNILPQKHCVGNQVARQLMLGKELGVVATPTTIYGDGEIQPGYLPPRELLGYLRSKSKNN